MLQPQINQAQDILLRLHKQRQLVRSGLKSFEAIERDHPEVLVSRVEIVGYHESVKPILRNLFGDDAELCKEWSVIPHKFDMNTDDVEMYYIECFELFIIFLNKIETIHNIDTARNPQKQEIIMGGKYVTGQAGAVGPGAHAHDMTFGQIWSQVEKSIDLPSLAEELGLLRQSMKKEATEPELDVAVGAIATAEQAAKAGNGPKALESLKSAGKWALDLSEKIGVGGATAAIKTALGV
jgi:hypothetical protein